MSRIAQIQQKRDQLAAEQREQEEIAAQEERDLVFLQFRLGEALGLRPRSAPYPAQYMTVDELRECIEYAKANNFASVREMFKDIQEREYPWRVAQDIKKYSHLYHPESEQAQEVNP